MNRLPGGRVKFVKMSGAGNDFILIDHREEFLEGSDLATFARLVCRRRFSVGADGLILIEKSDEADFKWQFFNADGSVAEMCGNGARCAARFAFTYGIAPRRMRFSTLAGVIEAEVSGEQVRLNMSTPKALQLDQQLSVDDDTFIVHGVNTGVPHVVVLVEDVAAVDVKALGRALRFHEAFQPAGTNVNIVQAERDHLRVRTYERGVEGETLACGTGCVAAALIAACKLEFKAPVRVIPSGGVALEVSFERREASLVAENVTLKGPAHLVYKGELTDEALIDPDA
ncbi:MAG: diaminopimelate epimerase [Desulfobulbus propionicus]|nr:MAG: diaminopimelate epimerase [Desulfobulbus propionicus]